MSILLESDSSEKAAQSEEKVLNRLKTDTDKIKVKRHPAPCPHLRNRFLFDDNLASQKVEAQAKKSSKLAKAVEEARKKNPAAKATTKQVFRLFQSF